MDINIKNLEVFELEMVPNFRVESLTRPEQLRITRRNDKLLDEYMEKDIVPMANFECPICHSKNEDPTNIVDRDIGVIIGTNHGHMTGVDAVVTRCSKCGHVETMAKSILPIMNNIMRGLQTWAKKEAGINQPRPVAISAPTGMTKVKPTPANVDRPKIVLEDMETGEKVDAAPFLEGIGSNLVMRKVGR